MTKNEVEMRLKELKGYGYGKNDLDLKRELEYSILEYLLDCMEDEDILIEDIENVVGGLIEYILDIHIGENLESFISKGECL